MKVVVSSSLSGARRAPPDCTHPCAKAYTPAPFPWQGLWFAFPITYVVVKMGLVDLQTEEWLWTIGDFMGQSHRGEGGGGRGEEEPNGSVTQGGAFVGGRARGP